MTKAGSSGIAGSACPGGFGRCRRGHPSRRDIAAASTPESCSGELKPGTGSVQGLLELPAASTRIRVGSGSWAVTADLGGGARHPRDPRGRTRTTSCFVEGSGATLRPSSVAKQFQRPYELNPNDWSLRRRSRRQPTGSVLQQSTTIGPHGRDLFLRRGRLGTTRGSTPFRGRRTRSNRMEVPGLATVHARRHVCNRAGAGTRRPSREGGTAGVCRHRATRRDREAHEVPGSCSVPASNTTVRATPRGRLPNYSQKPARGGWPSGSCSGVNRNAGGQGSHRAWWNLTNRPAIKPFHRSGQPPSCGAKGATILHVFPPQSQNVLVSRRAASAEPATTSTASTIYRTVDLRRHVQLPNGGLPAGWAGRSVLRHEPPRHAGSSSRERRLRVASQGDEIRRGASVFDPSNKPA